MTDRQTYTMTGGAGAMSEWHHGYAAGDILRAVARAFEEAADSRAYLPDFPEFVAVTQWLRATAQLTEIRARNLSPTAHGLVSDICLWLLEFGRALIGTPVGSNRLDYLLCDIANQQPSWIEPLKRRKSWLDTDQHPTDQENEKRVEEAALNY